MMKSPSTGSPFSSTARQRSASPSNAMPASTLCVLTYSISDSICVEPQPSLMLTPLGSFASMCTFAPSSVNSVSAVIAEEPFAQSSAISRPSSEKCTVDFTWSM